MLRALVTALAALLLLLPGAAHAAKDQRTIVDAPRDLLDPAARPAALAELESLGVTDLRVVLYWRDVAPAPASRTRPSFDGTDPAAYAWGQYEALVAAAAERGWGVVLTPTGPVPRWATNGARDQLTRPSPNEFRKFVTAASRQFSSRITTWSIWNEPNHPDFLLPQYDARKRPLSPDVYRRLYAAAIRGLDDAGDRRPVLLGETAPIGTGKVVSPLRFLRGTLCLDGTGRRRVGRCARLRVDGIAHHPYTRKTGPYFVPPNPADVTIGALGRLVTFVQRAERGGVLARGTGLHLTEFGIQSLPDPLVGVPQQRQAEFRAVSEKLAWDLPRVETFSQYLLTDDDPNPSAPPIARYPGFESGLKLADGRRKLAFDGFRLPTVVRRAGSRFALWGLVRPGGTGTARTATLEQRDGARGAWRRAATLRTNPRGYWSLRVPARDGRQFRVVWTAPDGTSFAGAPTRATKPV